MHDVCGDVEIERSTANFVGSFWIFFYNIYLKEKKLTVSKYSFKNPPLNDFSSEKFLF